jgi:uncharacterized membrane protein
MGMEVADLLLRLGSVWALAFFSFWSAIPVGIALGIAPAVAGAAAWSSYAAGVLLVVVLGEPLRARLLKRFSKAGASQVDSPIRRTWDRYGLIGLCLLAPVTTGAQIGAIVALALGARPRRLLIGMVIGAALWATAITLALALGLAVVQPG